MTGKQEIKLTMYVGTEQYLTDNASIVEVLPNFQVYFGNFKDAIASIQIATGKQIFNQSGYGTEKGLDRDELVSVAADTARKLTAFAVNDNNQVLLKEVDIPESTFKHSRDMLLKELAQGVYNRAQTHLSHLADYGITEVTQNNLKNAIANYGESIPKPLLGKTEQKKGTAQLVKQFKAGDEALAKIDLLVEIVKTSQPDFYNGFKTVRKLISTGTRSLALKGIVTDAATGEPLKGVKLTFAPVETGTPAKGTKAPAVLVKKTAAKGGLNVKALAAGVYEVTATKNGYKEQMVTVAVNESETAMLKIQL